MRREAPAAARNRQPILDVLQPRLPEKGLVLEIASGTGEHVVHYAAARPGLTFQPSDPDANARASIDDWVRTLGLNNVRPALEIDVTGATWPVERADAVLCCNMIHIAPWEAAVGLLTGAGRLLPPGGLLFTYGPYRRGGRHRNRHRRHRRPGWRRDGLLPLRDPE
jgi:SAM-dependent methyltransferase